MAQNQYNQLEYEAPIFSVQAITTNIYQQLFYFKLITVKNFIIVSCGGGGKNVGMKNKIVFSYNIQIFKKTSFKYTYPFKSLNNKICDIDTESQLIENLVSNKSENLIIGSSDENCIVFSLNSEGNLKQIALFQTDFKIKEPCQNIVKFNAKGNLIATGGDDGIIRIWDIDYQNENFQAKLSSEIISHSNTILSLDFHPIENILASVAKDKLCIITEIKQQKQLKKLSIADQTGQQDNLNFSHCLFSTNGQFLYTIQSIYREDSYLTKWDAFGNFEPLLSVNICNNLISSVKINSKLLAFGSCEGLGIIYNLKSDKIVQKKTLHDMIVKTLDFTKDQKYLITGAGDLTYNIYGIKNSNSIASFVINFIKFFIILALLLILNKVI